MNNSLEVRISRLENEVHRLLSQSPATLVQNSSPVAPGAGTQGPETAPAAQGGSEGENFPSGTIISWQEFEADIQDLDLQERLQVVDVAIALLGNVFAHLPLKRAMLGIDPVQRLRVLRRRLQWQQRENGMEQESARAFHAEMIDIFHSLRDLHTVYFLPRSYHRRTAFLPFLIEEYFDNGRRHYIVTKTMPGFTHPTFKVGVTITHWNSVPIDRAVELNAAREAGSNDAARHARGLESLTLRPMGMSAPPDELWVDVGYDDGQPREERFEWKVVFTQPSPNGAGSIGSTSLQKAEAHTRIVMGFDAVAERIRRVRKSVFYKSDLHMETHMAKVVAETRSLTQPAMASQPLGQAPGMSESAGRAQAFPSIGAAAQCMKEASFYVSSTRAGPVGSSDTSMLPEFFSFRRVPTPDGNVGYVRIWSFMTFDANAFVAEFARIVEVLGCDRLIIDLRGNGGGLIWAGEMLLQSLTANRIESGRFHFINTDTTLNLCNRFHDLRHWVESIDLSLLTSEVFSQGFPLTPPQMLAGVTRAFSGKVVIIVDALCYSTTDIFAAGFQDHEIGKILGTSGCTGAGGANVVAYDFFTGLDEFPSLPKGVSFNVAIRRSTRTVQRQGVPLEGLGVVPDQIHKMTRRDVLGNNEDLINTAISMF